MKNNFSVGEFIKYKNKKSVWIIVYDKGKIYINKVSVEWKYNEKKEDYYFVMLDYDDICGSLFPPEIFFTKKECKNIAKQRNREIYLKSLENYELNKLELK